KTGILLRSVAQDQERMAPPQLTVAQALVPAASALMPTLASTLSHDREKVSRRVSTRQARVPAPLIPLLAVAAWQASALEPIPRFPIRTDPLAITRPVEAAKPFTVVGERGAIFGEQSGTFEAWLYPVKILSHFTIAADLSDYPVPVDVTRWRPPSR